MGDDEVRTLLDCFSASIREVLPVTALWVHGSLALGDFQLVSCAGKFARYLRRPGGHLAALEERARWKSIEPSPPPCDAPT
jgi:hypothetical protein